MGVENENGVHPTETTIAGRVRLIHFLYAATLIYAGNEAFGVSGIFLAAVFCAAWARVYWSLSRSRAIPGALLILLLAGVLYGLLAPAISAAGRSTTRMQCSNNLKQIALALHNYHEVYRSFPPAYLTDDTGRPMHSWRVLILPFLEGQRLHEAYRFDEPWDGPNNSKLATPMPWAYSCTSHRPEGWQATAYTSYVAVVGENAAWPGQRAMRFNDIIDGTSRTLLVCEFGNRQINWMEPTDIKYDDAVQLLTSQDSLPYTGHIHRSFFYEWTVGRNAALADASVHFVAQAIKVEDAQRLLRVNDHQPFDADDLVGTGMETRRLRIDNCIRLGVFVLLTLWPLPWVWINPRGPRRSDEEVVDSVT